MYGNIYVAEINILASMFKDLAEKDRDFKKLYKLILKERNKKGELQVSNSIKKQCRKLIERSSEMRDAFEDAYHKLYNYRRIERTDKELLEKARNNIMVKCYSVEDYARFYLEATVNSRKEEQRIAEEQNQEEETDDYEYHTTEAQSNSTGSYDSSVYGRRNKNNSKTEKKSNDDIKERSRNAVLSSIEQQFKHTKFTAENIGNVTNLIERIVYDYMEIVDKAAEELRNCLDGKEIDFKMCHLLENYDYKLIQKIQKNIESLPESAKNYIREELLKHSTYKNTPYVFLPELVVENNGLLTKEQMFSIVNSKVIYSEEVKEYGRNRSITDSNIGKKYSYPRALTNSTQYMNTEEVGTLYSEIKKSFKEYGNYSTVGEVYQSESIDNRLFVIELVLTEKLAKLNAKTYPKLSFEERFEKMAKDVLDLPETRVKKLMDWEENKRKEEAKERYMHASFLEKVKMTINKEYK